MHRRLLILAFTSVIILGALHQLGSHFYFYWDIVWFDALMHFLGGFAVAMLFIWFSKRFGLLGALVLRTILFVIAVSVAWEVFEYYFDIANPIGGNYPLDTAKDLVSDMVGAAAAIYLGTREFFNDKF